MTTLKVTWSLVLAGAVVTAACGDSKSSMNPVAPSAVVIGAQSEEAGDPGAVSGTTGKPTNPGNGNGNGNNGNGNGNDKGKDKTPTAPTAPTAPTVPGVAAPSAPDSKKVEIEGLISVKGGNTLVVNGQIVVVPASCPIRHGSTQFTFAYLRVGDRVHVKAQRTTVGSGANALSTLEATEVKLQNPDEGASEEPTELVSVSAVDALAGETGANTGTFRITRSGSAILLALPATMNFTLTGTATNGTDYTNIPLTATIPAGLATVDVIVTPTADTTTEGPETVILTLTTVTPYELGSPATATVTITDTATPLVSVTAFDSTASETAAGVPADTGTFRFTRTGSTASPLVVTFTVGGTATAADYMPLPVSLSVTIPAGASTVDLILTPVSDALPEAPETVEITVSDGATYDVGAPAAATVTITG